MPLLVSPIDGKPMTQIKRFGIEIDVCPTSGGIWLDKGELEKLMALIREEVVQERKAHHPREYSENQSSQHYHSKPKYKKKESTLEKIMDIFDF